MGVDDILERRSIQAEQAHQRQQAQQQSQNSSGQPAGGASNSGGGSLTITIGGPDGSFERDDAIFWMLVIDTLLLLIIALKV